MISVDISVGMSSCQLAIRGAEPLHGLDISTNQMYNVFAILGLKTCINAFRVYRYDSKPQSLTQTLHIFRLSHCIQHASKHFLHRCYGDTVSGAR
jgi:hypothetical protein